MPTARVNGAELYYEDEGNGRPVVFIHGLWTSSRFFHLQVPSFAERYRTIAVDLRGHGRSAQTHAGHTVAQHARDVHSLLEMLDLRDVVLAGWSMGSLVIFDYVEQFGTERLAGIVDIDQTPTDFKWPDWPYGLFDLQALHRLHTNVQTNRAEVAPGFVPVLFKELPPDDEIAWMIAEIERIPEGIACAILFDQSVVDYRSTLPKVTVPALLCIGRGENVVPVAAGEYMADRMPDATLVVFEDSDHCPFLEEPDRFNEVVHEWIQRLPA